MSERVCRECSDRYCVEIGESNRGMTIRREFPTIRIVPNTIEDCEFRGEPRVDKDLLQRPGFTLGEYNKWQRQHG